MLWMQADLTYRIGTLAGGPQDVKGHPWFQGINWPLLEERKYKAPFMPKLRSEGDSSNFDDYSKLGPFKHEFKLSADQQAQFSGF
jgi:protein kinase A